jgi:hypothetical protein
MYQRSSTYVMTTKNGFDVLFAGNACPHLRITVNSYIFSSGLYCENGPPTDIADRINASFPHFMGIELGQRSTARIAELDKFVKLDLRL